MGRHEVRVNSRKGVQCKPWWDAEVKAALKARRAANREHRSAIRHLSAEDCEQAWHKYLELKRHMQQLVQRNIAESDHKKLKELTTPGRKGIQNFWRYISALDRKSPSRPTLREEATGEPVFDVKKRITDYIQNVFGAPAPVAAAETVAHITPARGDPQAKECEWNVSRVALERALARIASQTAQGLDGIPAGLVKRLGKIAREHLAAIFTGIIEGNPIPVDWLRSRVCLVPKKGADSGCLSSYRPITVTSVLYRLFAQVVKTWMSGWAENSGHLMELQNGFHPNRCLTGQSFRGYPMH
ncbi:hypothetical protein HPB50_019626 [Hyalomma asiaticum]|uniref:Uncharacterized protein n=1 Tax=Hyalomma asiaticum TaxID=266040 RepID=A0ACB7RT74_HYAAI|nr:hypothetical protein HPB50_019626 [Hyalomma asiaticum]